MNNIVPFSFKGNEVRVIHVSGEPWWVAIDICRALNLDNPTMALKRLMPSEKGLNRIETLGGPQDVNTVNEPGLYRLIFRSDRKEALDFQTFVFTEILPTIRKTGRYGAPEPTVEARIARLEKLIGIEPRPHTPLPPLRRISPRGQVIDGQKTCSRCRETKPLMSFAPSAKGAGGRYSQCNRCVANRMRQLRYDRMLAC